MATKRMRVFAGPNGSGKTTIITNLKNKIPFGVYVNADDIERELKTTDTLGFNQYNLLLNTQLVQLHFKTSNLSPIKHSNANYWKYISVKDNKLLIDLSLEVDSYLSADIAELLRVELLNAGMDFSYETVMSHPEKVNFLKNARLNGYRVYLYYIATEDPEININRVNVRVAQDGHTVSADKIKSRYYKSLENLKAAVKQTSRTYIFDNSGTTSLLIAEITDGITVDVFDPEKAPNWFVKYLVE